VGRFLLWARSRSAPLGARALLVGLVALAAAACGTRTSYPGQNPFEDGGQARELRIRVRNNNFYDATLTALTDTGRRRLGTVGGNQSSVFTIPWTFTGGLRIEIDLLAGPTCTTDYLTVSPGESVDLEIMSDFNSMPYCR
jgi:hypothetical protein